MHGVPEPMVCNSHATASKGFMTWSCKVQEIKASLHGLADVPELSIPAWHLQVWRECRRGGLNAGATDSPQENAGIGGFLRGFVLLDKPGFWTDFVNAPPDWRMIGSLETDDAPPL